jgi:hypothetical protein
MSCFRGESTDPDASFAKGFLDFIVGVELFAAFMAGVELFSPKGLSSIIRLAVFVGHVSVGVDTIVRFLDRTACNRNRSKARRPMYICSLMALCACNYEPSVPLDTFTRCLISPPLFTHFYTFSRFFMIFHFGNTTHLSIYLQYIRSSRKQKQ